METRNRTLSCKTRSSHSLDFTGGIVACPALQQLHLEHAKQLDKAISTCGFQNVVVPRLFNESMGFTAQALKERRIAPAVDLLFDQYFELGITPILHIDEVPRFLQSDAKKPDSSLKSVAPRPKLLTRWLQLLDLFFHHASNRYGKTYVSSWSVVIGQYAQELDSNESIQQEWLRFYEKTARKVKELLPSISVGGPALATHHHDLLAMFYKHCIDFETPLDFITLEAHLFDCLNTNGQTKLFSSRKTLADRDKKTYEQIQEYFDVPPPIILMGLAARDLENYALHDSYVYPSLLLEAVLPLRDRLKNIWIHRLSDGIDTSAQSPLAFRGAPGLFTAQGHAKPIKQLFSFLHAFTNNELVHDYHDCYATIDTKGGVHALIWNPFQPQKDLIPQVYFNTDHAPLSECIYEVSLGDVAPGHYHLQESRIGYQRGDPYSLYLEQDKPAHLSLEEASIYKQAAHAVKTEMKVTVRSDRNLVVSLPMHEAEIVYLRIRPASL